MPCCSKELSPPLSLCLFPSFSPPAHVRLSKGAERQAAGRAVTITPFRSIQTFWGGGAEERRKGEGDKMRRGTNSLQSFRLEYTMCV